MRIVSLEMHSMMSDTSIKRVGTAKKNIRVPSGYSGLMNQLPSKQSSSYFVDDMTSQGYDNDSEMDQVELIRLPEEDEEDDFNPQRDINNK